MMKWVNSRRFVICIICLVIIAYSAVFGEPWRVAIATALVPVLCAFMGATTIEKVGAGLSRRSSGERGAKEDADD